MNSRTDPGGLVPFAGGGKVVLTLKFRFLAIDPYEFYYHNQANLPNFSRHYGQQASDFGVLALGIGRVAFPLARKLLIPAAKNIGKNFFFRQLQN